MWSNYLCLLEESRISRYGINTHGAYANRDYLHGQVEVWMSRNLSARSNVFPRDLRRLLTVDPSKA